MNFKLIEKTLWNWSTAVLVFSLLMLFGCAHTLPPPPYQGNRQDCADLDNGLSGIAADSTYGYIQTNPVRIGGGSTDNELTYMHMLLGPNKELIGEIFKVGSYWAAGSTLSGYKVVINGDTLPKTIYLDTRHCHDPQAPIGFNIKEEFKEVKTKTK